MPPKQQQAPNKKSQEKIKNKIIEDKTFGLKNKKGAKQQKFIQQVQKQVQNKMAPKNPRDILEDQQKKKEEEKKKKEEIAALFKPVVTQTVAKGVDPKSVVCVYFKQNLCQKGDKCKFSHDLSIERKSEKRNVYEDIREQDSMENWDDQKLEDVVNRKHGEDNVKKNQTQIVCKYFIEAVENKTYGWFWNCPNGESCIYRHALPPGFTLKSEMKKKDEEEEISIEMLVEKERASLSQGTTRVTLESFLAWKARKLQEKKDERKKNEEKKMKDYKLGFMNGLTGRDIFTFNPDLITNDDEDAQADIDYRQREEDADQDELILKQCRELNPDYFLSQAREADGTGTVATEDRFSYMDGLLASENERIRRKKQEQPSSAQANEEDDEAEDEGEDENGDAENDDDDDDDDNDDHVDDDENEEEQKQKLKNLISNNNSKTGGKAKSNGIEIDESLFNQEDLQDLDEELEKLDI